MKSPERERQMFCLHAEWIDRFQLVKKLRCPFRSMLKCVRVTWGGVHPHSRILLPQADMLCPVGAKHNFRRMNGQSRLCFGLKGQGMSAHGIAQGLRFNKIKRPEPNPSQQGLKLQSNVLLKRVQFCLSLHLVHSRSPVSRQLWIIGNCQSATTI